MRASSSLMVTAWRAVHRDTTRIQGKVSEIKVMTLTLTPPIPHPPSPPPSPVPNASLFDSSNPTKTDECSLCHPSCDTCDGPSGQDCLTCLEDQFLHDDNSCDSHCPYSTYADKNDWRCKDCDDTCQSCSGAGQNACETCEGGLFWESKYLGRNI